MDSLASNCTPRRRALIAAAVLAFALALPGVAHAQLMSFDGSFGSALQDGLPGLTAYASSALTSRSTTAIWT